MSLFHFALIQQAGVCAVLEQIIIETVVKNNGDRIKKYRYRGGV